MSNLSKVQMSGPVSPMKAMSAFWGGDHNRNMDWIFTVEPELGRLGFLKSVRCPSDDGSRLDDDQDFFPTREKAGKNHPGPWRRE
ncbi:MAG: hypothetical protein GY822_08445 [Deltaproteobacteria bacterium]|nr:hypothetical protein [Deltaproteobacteria bacterium]